MTVIAFDGHTLAGDRLCTVNGVPTPATRKVFRLVCPNGKVGLVGLSGDTAYTGAYLRWMMGGEEPKPVQGEESKWCVLLVEAPRWVWIRTSTANRWDLIGATQWAIGSGGDFALGAMEAGSSAREAVRIASRLDVNCGLGVDVVRFG